MIDLDAVEQRILGSLMEKQVTVPASYPLTLSSLRSACNQTSSREPVMDLDDRTLEETAKRLKERELVRIVWSDTGRRTLKYHQVLEERLGLDEAERAVVTVLLLRGAQSPGELRTRTERLHPFADRDAVEATLQALAARPEPLVQQLERRPREQDHRWIHLLGEVAGAAEVAPAAAAVVGTEEVLREGGAARDARVVATYDAIAEPYAATLVPELQKMPFERWLLERIAEHTLDHGGPAVEVGSGPGHVTAHLAALGVETVGVDLSPGMVEEARRRFPDGDYRLGDLRQLMRPERAAGWSTVLAWYSLIHLAGSELPDAVAALTRPLAPGGLLVLALHAGSGVKHQPVWFEHQVDVDIALHDQAEVAGVLAAAGFSDLEWYRRGPIAARNEATERLYVLARR